MSVLLPVDKPFQDAAQKNGYKLHKIPTCPNRYIWKSTLAMIFHPLFIEALGYEAPKQSVGALLREPANWSQLVRHARNELSALNNIQAIAGAEQRHLGAKN